jgi:hypothetical protein
VFGNSGYLGERLKPIEADYFHAVVADTTADFLTANPTLVNAYGPPPAAPTG